MRIFLNIYPASDTPAPQFKPDILLEVSLLRCALDRAVRARIVSSETSVSIEHATAPITSDPETQHAGIALTVFQFGALGDSGIATGICAPLTLRLPGVQALLVRRVFQRRDCEAQLE